MSSVYIGRQPILDANANLIAYEILYRDVKQEASANSNRYASAHVINTVLNKFGARSILGKQKAFVKVDEKFLMHDLIFTIPKEFFIFTIFNDIEMSERVVERIQQLYAKGFELAINDISLTQESLVKYEVIFKELSHVKVNIDKLTVVGYKDLIMALQKNDVNIVGTKIEDRLDYAKARALGCNWFQGYYFAEPKILENAKYEPSQKQILNIYNLLMQDTSIDEITQEFENSPELTVQLLQFINSGAFHFRTKISSIHHIIMLVGRTPLAQWLMLMIYSKSVSRDNAESPLMLMVKNRTQLMENVLTKLEPQVKSNRRGEAYLTGVLSLLDTVFGVKLETILSDMHISSDVKNALLLEEGVLGEIYALVKDIEGFDVDKILAFESKHHLKEKDIESMAFDGMKELDLFFNPELEE